MTVGELLDALAAARARLLFDPRTERPRYVGPRLAPGSPVARALATFHDEVAWLVAAGRLCVFCPRLLPEGDPIACAEHRRQLAARP